jgi:hypothetical protein
MRLRLRHLVIVASTATLLATAACGAILDVQDVPDPSGDGGATFDASGADATVGPVDGSSGDGSVGADATTDGAGPTDAGPGVDGSSDAAPSGPETVLEAPMSTMNFGTCLAFSSDSTLLAVGAPGVAAGESSVVVYVVRLEDGKLLAMRGDTISPPPTDPAANATDFGSSVAFGRETSGSFPLAVGAPTSTGGSVTIWTVGGSTGTHTGEPFLLSAPASAVNFGASVAFDADGDLYVGAPGAASSMGSGSVYVYLSANGGWPVSPTSGSVGISGDLFGASLASVPDGGVLVGSPGAGGIGTAYLLTEAAVPTPSSANTPSAQRPANSEMGQAVAIAGSNALVGLPGYSAAYLLGVSLAKDTWSTGSTASTLIPNPQGTSATTFGRSVAVADDQYAIGGDGFVAVYGLGDGQTQIVTPASPSASSSFGASLAYGAVSGNHVLAVGAPPSTAVKNGGSVDLFVSPAP